MIKKYKNYSNTWIIDSGKPGPILAVFGGIHGHEIAGIKAIDRFVAQINNREFQINKGKLILAYGNENAIELAKRDYLYNMNRLFQGKYLDSDSNEPEIRRVQQLADILENSDYLLDIHSVSSESVPFLFAENTDLELDIASSLGLEKVICGWGEINENTVIGGDSDSYMHSLGKIAFTVECGNHNDKGAENLAYNTILKYLSYLFMINLEVQKKETKLIVMKKIAITQTGKFVFSEGIYNFKYIEKGEFIGYDDKKKIIAEDDFTILLPNYEEKKPGDEVFYYGYEL